jgi:3-isopropylmalate dehydratase small subunit
MTLTRKQRRVKEAFNDAFRTKAKLQQFVKDELDKNLDSIGLTVANSHTQRTRRFRSPLSRLCCRIAI